MAISADITTGCCVAGGGPAGMLYGFLLARAGVDVVVLEKHKDFNRDFRGDTIHPSTLQVMYELGLLDAFLKLPHQELREIGASIGGSYQPIGDFRHVPTHAKFLALMPQWDFLNFLRDQGRAFPHFRVEMSAEAVDLVREGGRITGVRVRTADGEHTIGAPLVVAADGRSSTMRARAGLKAHAFGAPIDVLWMRIPKSGATPPETLGIIAPRHMLIMIDRESYYQAAFVIPKGVSITGSKRTRSCSR